MKNQLRHETIWFWFIAPTLLLILSMELFPILVTLSASFVDFNPILSDRPRWVGLANYLIWFDSSNQEIWFSLGRTALFAFLSVFFESLLGLILACFLRHPFPARGWIFGLLLLPVLMSPAVMGTFIRYLFDSEFGAVNWILNHHLIWGGSSPLSFMAVLVLEVWTWTPFMMLLSLAALSTVPHELNEAAKMDGAGMSFRLRRITLPLVAPLLLMGWLFRMVDAFNSFDMAMVFNGAIESQPTTWLSLLIYGRAFEGSRSIGEPAALACLMFAVAMFFALVFLRVLNRWQAKAT